MIGASDHCSHRTGASDFRAPRDRVLSMDEWSAALRDEEERARLLTEVDALIESISTEREPLTIAGDWVPAWAEALRLAANLADKSQVYALACQARSRLLAEHGFDLLAETDAKL